MLHLYLYHLLWSSVSYEITKCTRYYGKTGFVSYAYPRLSWKLKLVCDRKAPFEDSLLFLLFFDILLFLHPPAPGVGRQIKANKSMAKFFLAETLF